MVTTRTKMLATAEQLANERGARGFGLDDVLKGVGVSKTTFYKYFKSKDALSVEVVNDVTAQLVGEVKDELRTRFGSDSESCLLNILPIWLNKIRDKGWNGCLFSKFCHAYPDAQEPLADVARAFPVAVKDTIGQLCSDLPIANPERLAQQITIVLQGAATYGFIFGIDPSGFESAATALVANAIELAKEGR